MKQSVYEIQRDILNPISTSILRNVPDKNLVK